MQKYTKIYLDYFKLKPGEFVACEICGTQATEIHHIHNRSHRKDLLNDINNLMAICRTCHIKYGDIKKHKPLLIKIHKKKLNG